MSKEIAGTAARISSGFRRVVDVFLAGEGLPFSQVLSAERIERICGSHGCLFGRHGIYSTPVVLWAFLSLATGAITNLACGPYQGKQMDETAMLRSMLDSFQPRSPAVQDAGNGAGRGVGDDSHLQPHPHHGRGSRCTP